VVPPPDGPPPRARAWRVLDAAARQAKVVLSWAAWGLAVTGDTFGAKEALKQRGGKWDAGRKAWVFPSEAKVEVLEALRDMSGLKVEDKARAALTIAFVEDGEGIAVTGETFPVKSLLRGLEGKWSKPSSSWVFPVASLQALRQALCASGDVGEVVDHTKDAKAPRAWQSVEAAATPKSRVVARRVDAASGVKPRPAASRGVKVVESASEKRQQRQRADGSREMAVTRRITKKASCGRTGALVESQTVTKRRQVTENAHEVVETSTVTVKRVRRKG